MSNFSVPLGILPNSILTTFPDRSAMTLNPSYHRVHLGEFSFSRRTTLLRGEFGVTRFGLGQIPFPDPENAGGIIKHIFDRAEGFLYTVADAAVSGSYDDVVDSTKTVTTDNSDWFSGITSGMESVLKVLKDGLSTLHVPYPYGFAIILLTVLVKAATFPLTKKQVESAMAMRSMAPQIKAIQERYSGDQEKIQLETARLYKLAGINPLAGCLPTLATIPIWIGLYRALSNVANEGLLTEGFFWIPSLAGPTTIAARQTGSGTSWLFPFVDGHPPLGWSDTLAYLVLPVLLVITQYISIQIMQPPQSNDPNLKNSQAITKFLPLMIGYFALSVPSGLSLYWFTNNILSTAQQIWLQKLGGAKNPVKEFKDDAVLKELPKLQISTSDAALKEKRNKAVEKKTKAGEQLTSEGLRPGERFKQLKAEEARRRQQREEERRKVEEAEAKAQNTKLKKEANLDEIKVVNEADESTISRTSETLTGSRSAPELKDPINGSKVHNNGDNGRSDQHPHSTSEKEELGHSREEDTQNVFTGKDTEEDKE